MFWMTCVIFGDPVLPYCLIKIIDEVGIQAMKSSETRDE